ncbi:RagB/SusD family nutrient uptake outer membrane protein [Segetibacter sp. 3557_3]|uniref:RagB/SusD family nutrient uptake outer membrane protein n=1 Tax=Segetibacter sp. 3557_3 TaxID=2547429 RepID=UPI001058BA03|nr:RagB/SusD family nutrient uptake outer membrane protein [Segetibacter sp. 3557_3]TDH24216.1 RagB/SusD family nutrient uptake outer membrane protein [Segetibacter sp. 3557_3]
MKKFLTIKNSLLFILLLSFGTACTKLDEQLYGRVTSENFFKTDAEVLAALAGVYNNMGFAVNGGNLWRLLHLGTDEFIMVARSDGRWLDGGVYIEFFEHKWTPINNRLGSYSDVFRTIGSANAVLEGMQSSPNAANIKAQIAEARGIRAYAYFYAMDLWGNVPIVTTARIEPSNLPETKTRKEVFDFVVAELTAAANDLPSAKTVGPAYYPRMTKEAAYAILALTYLNAEVFAGKAYWAECIEMCDKVAAGGYILTPSYIDNFKVANEGSKEFIYAVSIDPTKAAGSNNFAQRTLHDSHAKTYNLPFIPQNGFNIVEDAYNRFEAQDIRRSLILAGPQFAADGVTPLRNIANTANLVLVPIVNPKNAAENEGYRLMKWQPDNTWVNGGAGNDVATIRYSEILLTKAEAILRSGGSAATALGLVNQVRVRSNATPLQSITINDILDERGRELMWEGTRRRDMIRFGTFFTWTPFFKPTVTPAFRGLLPIPATELGANPKLKQNPGY